MWLHLTYFIHLTCQWRHCETKLGILFPKLFFHLFWKLQGLHPVALQSPSPKARESQPLQTNTLDSLQSERPRWRLGMEKWSSGHGWQGSASCYESHHQVLMEMKTASMPCGPESSPGLVHMTWSQISKWRLSFCIHWQRPRQTGWGEKTMTTRHTRTLWPIITLPYKKASYLKNTVLSKIKQIPASKPYISHLQ